MPGFGGDVMRVMASKDPTVALQQAAASIDKPICRVKIEFGELHVDGITRTITFTCVDRLDERFAPTLFRNTDGTSPGRWLIQFYAAITEYGTPVDINPTATLKGKLFGNTGYLYTAETDSAGVVQIDAGKAITGALWVHAGFAGLLRSKGIDWITGAYPTGTEAADATDPSLVPASNNQTIPI